MARETEACERRCRRRRVEVHGFTFRPEIFGSCKSKAVEDHGIVTFPKSWADLQRFEGLSRGSFERSWLRLGARGWTFGVDFPGFCRSEVDGSSGGIGFVKFFLDLRRLE